MSASKAAMAAGIERGTTQIAETVGRTRQCILNWFNRDPHMFQASLDYTLKIQRFDYCLRVEKRLAGLAAAVGSEVRVSAEPDGPVCRLVFATGPRGEASYVRRTSIPLGISYAEDVAKFWQLIKRDLEL